MAPDTLTNAPPLGLHTTEIVDLGGADPVSELVGRPGYLANVQVDDCLPPVGRGPREPAVFDRSYYPVDGAEERVLVDVLSGGSAAEISEMEAQRRVAEKTAWCAERKIRYICFIDPTLAPYS
jgi:hypothetical protein